MILNPGQYNLSSTVVLIQAIFRKQKTVQGFASGRLSSLRVVWRLTAHQLMVKVPLLVAVQDGFVVQVIRTL